MRYLIIILWILLGIGYWFISRDCCIPSTSTDPVKTVVPIKEEVKAVSGPLLFNWSNGNPILGKGWPSYRDSIKSTIGENQLLQITGLYRRDEQNKTTFANLGLARADSVQSLLGLADNEVKLSSRIIGSKSSEKTNKFESVSFRPITVTKNIKEEEVKDENNNISIRTSIYFPFNSTNKLNDSEVESYLNQVASRVKSSNEKVKLVGHTDNVGGEEANLALGESRATIISQYLISKGVKSNRIIVQSKGEMAPIANNNTDAGRAKNRRTELTIIK